MDGRNFELLFSLVVDAFSYEKNRATALDNKAIALVSITCAIIGFCIPLVPVYVVIMNIHDSIVLVLFILLIVSFIISIFIIVFCIFNVLMPKKYQRFDHMNVMKKEVLFSKHEDLLNLLKRQYVDILNVNIEINDKKEKTLRKTPILVFSTIILIFACVGLKVKGEYNMDVNKNIIINQKEKTEEKKDIQNEQARDVDSIYSNVNNSSTDILNKPIVMCEFLTENSLKNKKR